MIKPDLAWFDMNFYLIIVFVGLIVKIIISFREILQPSKFNRSIRFELVLFVFLFIGYSISQIFVFAPSSWYLRFGLDRFFVVQLYYFFDGVCLLIGMYILLSILGFRKHKNWMLLGLIFSYIVIGGYFLFFTEAFVSHVVSGKHSGSLGLGAGYGGRLIFLPRFVVVVCLLFISYSIYLCYKAAKENELQIKSLYVLVAGFIYSSNCLLGLFFVMPLNIALRGVLFFMVVLLVVRRNSFFDIRLSTPNTLENKMTNTVKANFINYANHGLSFRKVLMNIEKSMVEYKVKKAKGFNSELNSSLPLASDLMGVSLGSLYALLKKHNLEHLKSKE